MHVNVNRPEPGNMFSRLFEFLGGARWVAVYGPRVTAVQARTGCGNIWALWQQEGQRYLQKPRRCGEPEAQKDTPQAALTG